MAARKRYDVAARQSALTGADLRYRLQMVGISAKDFADLFGVPVLRMRRVLQGDLDGHVPVSLEVALHYAERHGEELRRRPEPVNIDTNRSGYRLSNVVGAEISQRLRAIGWSVPDFARFIGTTDRTIRDIMCGQRDGTITLLLERLVEHVERYPLELQALPDVQTPVRRSPARREALYFMQDRKPAEPPRQTDATGLI